MESASPVFEISDKGALQGAVQSLLTARQAVRSAENVMDSLIPLVNQHGTDTLSIKHDLANVAGMMRDAAEILNRVYAAAAPEAFK